jgi:ferric-dicitrate binding protein FerR (iron transport regulator)
MTKDKIIKFLNNQCTDAELDETIRWANTEAFSEESIKRAFDEWKTYREESNEGDDEKFSLLFDKIRERINSERQKRNKTGNGNQIFMTRLTRAAAILLLPVLAFLFYTLSEIYDMKSESVSLMQLPVDSLEIIAPVGSRTVVQLSDGSKVHLNYGSRLKYPRTFTGNTREVLLTGEGYFDVAHNPERPFIVQAGEFSIKALGTAFNVMAYTDNDEIETTLVEGKVVLEKSGPEGKIIKNVGAILPGQHVSYNIKTGAVSCTEVNVEKYIAWKDGKLVFDEANILQVAERLSRMFNVTIEVDDDIKDYTYTVTFVDEPLFQILNLMTIATPVRYNALPRNKLSDGTYSKQKIIFGKKQ